MGTLSVVSCGRRNEPHRSYILDIDECGRKWMEENVVCKQTFITALFVDEEFEE